MTLHVDATAQMVLDKVDSVILLGSGINIYICLCHRRKKYAAA